MSTLTQVWLRAVLVVTLLPKLFVLIVLDLRNQNTPRASIPTHLDGVVFIARFLVPSVMNQMEAFHIFASVDRQLVLHELSKEDEKVRIEELSQQVTARRHQTPPEKSSDTTIERAYVRLVHGHLPTLQEKDIITVNWEENEAKIANEPEVSRLFEAAEELESWPPNDLLEHPSQSR